MLSFIAESICWKNYCLYVQIVPTTYIVYEYASRVCYDLFKPPTHDTEVMPTPLSSSIGYPILMSLSSPPPNSMFLSCSIHAKKVGFYRSSKIDGLTYLTSNGVIEENIKFKQILEGLQQHYRDIWTVFSFFQICDSFSFRYVFLIQRKADFWQTW